MDDKQTTRKYKNDEFKINCIYDENGKTLFNVIEEAFKSYYEYKIKT